MRGMMMKRLVLICLLALVCYGLYAKPSLYGIDFGQTKIEVSNILLNQGFEEVASGIVGVLLFAKDSEQYLDLISIHFDKDVIFKWYLSYNIAEDWDWADDFVYALADLHDTTPYFDDWMEEYLIVINHKHTIYLYMEDDDTVFTVEYSATGSY
jgi:hypothetical protein